MTALNGILRHRVGLWRADFDRSPFRRHIRARHAGNPDFQPHVAAAQRAGLPDLVELVARAADGQAAVVNFLVGDGELVLGGPFEEGSREGSGFLEKGRSSGFSG